MRKPGTKIGTRGDRRFRQSLGTRLRAVRKQHKLSQEGLGDKCGLSGKFIGEVERGEKSISMDSALLVSKVFGMSVAQFVGDGAPMKPEVAKLVALVERRPATEVEGVCNIVRSAISLKAVS